MADIPSNMMSISVSITIGGLTFTTALIVQTCKLEEVASVLDLAWQKTRAIAISSTAATL